MKSCPPNDLLHTLCASSYIQPFHIMTEPPQCTRKSLQFSAKSLKGPQKNKVQKLTHFYRCSNQGFIVLPLFKGNTFSWFNLRKRKQGCDPLFGFCFLPNCQSRVCCPAGYMTLSVSSHIIMEITSKKGMTWNVYYQVLTIKLQFTFVFKRSVLDKPRMMFPSPIFCTLFFESYSHSDPKCICARGKVQKLENPLALFSHRKYLHHFLH